MTILWVSWKDRHHPQAGGAEIVAHNIISRLLADGHAVTLLTCGYDGARAEEQAGKLRIIRVGANRYTHPLQAVLYYARRLRNTFDLLIEEVNGAAPYFSVALERRAKKFLLYHQLARKNWLYEVPQPLSHAGYWLLAPAATWLASRTRTPVITVSESTRRILARFGFPLEHTHIISEGIDNAPQAELTTVSKYPEPTVLSFGAMRPMKRTLDQIKAFERAKRQLPKLRLVIAGSSSGAYGQAVLQYVQRSPFAADITYLGRVSDAEKYSLMQQSHVILQTAIEEGWGLTITEAASQGTPAVAYDVAGLRDSIRHRETGILTKDNPTALADGLIQLLNQPVHYHACRQAAWEWSKQITFDQSYKDFKTIVGIA
ncbi:MAG TPA: glycosyltransferase family 4 protein [Candidatus Saccharimonadales bacterium]|nr:glycosyltransferase family 4 protein [Candidatus Saccharimonadales bacterium]